MDNEKFQYFQLEYKTYFIDLECSFEEMSSKVEKEMKAIFSLLVLALNSNVRINLQPNFFIDGIFLHNLLGLARDLRGTNRTLILKNAPTSIVRYLERAGLNRILLFQDNAA